jgi:large subunit ribosomal protein L17
MRHRKAGYKLSRNAPHRTSMYRNLAMALIRHERIITTVEKAKAVRPFVEKLITLAKQGTLHARRLVIMRLGPTSSAAVKPESDDKNPADLRTIVQKLFSDLGPRFKDRPGGYTRVVKRHERRLGDAGRTAYLELLKEGETKVRAKSPAPAPRIEEPPKEEAPGATESLPENPETQS